MTQEAAPPVKLSVIIPISERHDPIDILYQAYQEEIEALNAPYEVIFVVDGHNETALKQLEALKNHQEINILSLSRRFGETTALNAAIEESQGEIIMTLPAYQQVEPGRLQLMTDTLKEYDIVTARRWPRIDSAFNRIQTKFFNNMLKSFTNIPSQDAGCGIRVFRKSILSDIPLYGDMIRFLPVLAARQGFSVTEIDIPQSPKDARRKIHPPGVYMRRLLDILTVLFLTKFTQKPLRFFGLIGIALISAGTIITATMIIQRLFFNIALADRPALFLSGLLVVLGVQIIAVGLIAEILVFTHANELKEYKIKKILHQDKR